MKQRKSASQLKLRNEEDEECNRKVYSLLTVRIVKRGGRREKRGETKEDDDEEGGGQRRHGVIGKREKLLVLCT